MFDKSKFSGATPGACETLRHKWIEQWYNDTDGKVIETCVSDVLSCQDKIKEGNKNMKFGGSGTGENVTPGCDIAAKDTKTTPKKGGGTANLVCTKGDHTDPIIPKEIPEDHSVNGVHKDWSFNGFETHTYQPFPLK